MKSAIFLAVALTLTAPLANAANEFEGPLTALAQSELSVFATDPAVVEVLRMQNAAHAGLSQDDIDSRDQAWRAETATASRPLIDELLSRPASQRLKEIKTSMGGMVTEVFVTDALGLNAAQSDVTSDYWQGDEAKWQETFGKAAGTVHLGDIELDESTQTYQSQVSMPIHDPDSGAALGAVTIGIDLSAL